MPQNKILCDNSNILDYNLIKNYWSNVSPTTNCVLGGLKAISGIDIKYSGRFIQRLMSRRDDDTPYLERALDVGAGIGRVSKDLLNHIFKIVDLLDQDKKLLDEAKRVLQGVRSVDGKTNCTNFFYSGTSWPKSCLFYSVCIYVCMYVM